MVPLDKFHEGEVNRAEVSTSNGEMSALREELSAIDPAPRQSHAGDDASGSGVHMRRHRAIVEYASTNEGDEALETKKKRQRRAQALVVLGMSVILGQSWPWCM